MALCKHPNISGWGPWLLEGVGPNGEEQWVRTKHCLSCGDVVRVENRK